MSRVAGRILERGRALNLLSNLVKESGLKLKERISGFNFPRELLVCGVDGGFLSKDFSGVGVYLRRAVGVCFRLLDGKLNGVSYYPGKNPIPEIVCDFSSQLVEHDFGVLGGLVRSEKELEVAIGLVEKFKPEFLLLDGSIVLHPASVPRKGSYFYERYERVIELTKELYGLCEKNNVNLVGVVEDSRGARFCKIIYELLSERELSNKELLLELGDFVFLSYFLDVGEVTNTFLYSSEEVEIPSFKEMEEWKDKVYSCYLRPVKFDGPLRIDFLSPGGENKEWARKIISLVYELSRHNREYAFPSVLIEADARAKLQDVDLEMVKKRLAEKTGINPILLEKRRERRPF